VSLYVYGIVPEGAELPELDGLQGQAVTTLPAEGHAAIVSRVDEPETIGTPDDLVAHSSVLDRIAADVSVLPMVFGTVVPDEDTLVEEVLVSRHGLYAESLRRVEGSVQFSLRARFLRDVVLAELVEEQPEIASLREAIQGTSEAETRDERIRLGELVVQGLQRKAAEEAPRIRAALEPHVRELVERESAQAEDVVELAALVDRDQQDQFEQAAEELARQGAGRITFRLLGPQAPYDFTGSF
jgi:hypothetical protein